MTNYKPVANLLATDVARKREFTLQLVTAVAPFVTDYFLKISEKLIDLHICQNPGIDEGSVFSYEDHLAPRVNEHIRVRTTSIVEALSHEERVPGITGKTEDLSTAGRGMAAGPPM